MPDKQDEILAEVKELKSWLYGKNGFEGDIPEIKAIYKDHNKRIRRLELILAGIVAVGGLGGAGFGIVKFASG